MNRNISYVRRAVAFAASWVFLTAPFGAAAASNGAPLPTPPPASVSAIEPVELKAHLEFLASDELGGRYTLSPSIKIAARYLASRLESYGFKGAGPNGSFLQPFEVSTTKADAAKSSLMLEVGKERVDYPYGDFAIFGETAGTAEGDVVFVGYGVSSPSLGHDDYAGIDVKGKIVLGVPGIPGGIDSSKVGDTEQGPEAAAAHGAVGFLRIGSPLTASLLRSPDIKNIILSSESIDLAKPKPTSVPAVTLLPKQADRLLAPLGYTLDSLYKAVEQHEALRPKAFGARAHIALAVGSTGKWSQNVVGVLEGTDPKLKDEYVAVSAHYDHLETGPNGEVYHGADDDGSGTAAVLAIARAFSLERPKRSVLVVFHAGEELGLLGSEFNTDVAPVVPLDRIVVDLNIDMIGRSKPSGDTSPDDAELTDATSIYLIGADKISKELNEISERTNSEFAKLRLDYTYNDPNHPQQYYYRSDHWNYAKHGVPVIFYFNGGHVDYHQPSDTVDKIDFDKMTRVSRLVFETGWRVANLDHRLAKDAR